MSGDKAVLICVKYLVVSRIDGRALSEVGEGPGVVVVVGREMVVMFEYLLGSGRGGNGFQYDDFE